MDWDPNSTRGPNTSINEGGMEIQVLRKHTPRPKFSWVNPVDLDLKEKMGPNLVTKSNFNIYFFFFFLLLVHFHNQLK